MAIDTPVQELSSHTPTEDEKAVQFWEELRERGVTIHPRERYEVIPQISPDNLRFPFDIRMQRTLVEIGNWLQPYLDENAMEDAFPSTPEGETARNTMIDELRKKYGNEIVDKLYYQNNLMRSSKLTGALGWMHLLVRDLQRLDRDDIKTEMAAIDAMERTSREKLHTEYRALSGDEKLRVVHGVQSGILNTLNMLFGPETEDQPRKLVSFPVETHPAVNKQHDTHPSVKTL